MLDFPVDFVESTTDGPIDTGTTTSATSEAHLQEIRLLAPQTSFYGGPFPDFQVMVANRHLKTPGAAVQLLFEVGDILSRERFIVMTHLTSRIIGLIFYKEIALLKYAPSSTQFPFPFHADNTYSSINEPLINPTDVLI